MKSHFIHLYCIKSQRVFFFVILAFGLLISVYYSLIKNESNALFYILDLMPMLFGFFACLGVSSFSSNGTYNYYLLRYPHRNKVLIQAVFGVVSFYIVSAIIIFSFCFVTDEIIFLIFKGNTIAFSEVLVALIRFISLIILFTVLGVGIAFTGQSKTVSILLYMTIVWFAPVILVFFSLVKDGLGDVLTSYTISSISVTLASSSDIKVLCGTSILGFIWIVFFLAMGALRFGSYVNE